MLSISNAWQLCSARNATPFKKLQYVQGTKHKYPGCNDDCTAALTLPGEERDSPLVAAMAAGAGRQQGSSALPLDGGEGI
jgi:hypothetical protein